MKENTIKLHTNDLVSRINTDGCDENFVKATATIVKEFTDKLQKLADINKDENKEEETNKRWKPNWGEDYFRIGVDNDDIILLKWENDFFDNKHYNARNIYKTKEEAEFEVERRKIMAELQNYADEHNGEIAHPSYAFWLVLDEDDMSITVENDSFLPPVGTVLFSNGDIAYDAIETIGEDRILKYMFRVNPNKELHCNGDCECCDEYDPWDEEDED